MKNIKQDKTSSRKRVVIKINNKVIDSEDVTLNIEDIELLKKILFKNKIDQCQSCKAKVCLANKKRLTGPILEGMAVDNSYLVSECANHRQK